MERDGLVIVYTGGGKGKTTAALGMALRAVGHGKRICMIQFIKGSWHYGEMDSAGRLAPEFEMTAAGRGFVGIIDDKSPREDHRKAAQEAARISREKISSNEYDLVILDEINYAVNLGLVDLQDVIGMIRARPGGLRLGGRWSRSAPVSERRPFAGCAATPTATCDPGPMSRLPTRTASSTTAPTTGSR